MNLPQAARASAPTAALPTIGISAVVPVFNEAETIEEIVRRLEHVPVIRQIVVVDDCSRDGTQEIVRRLVSERRVVAAFHDRNRGKGAALRSGLPLVQEEYLAIQDADLEYDPRDFIAMAELIERYDAQVIYGSRFLGAGRSGMLWTHYLGNRGLTLLFNFMFGRWITDMETCYKLFRTSLLRQIGIDNDRFDVDPELTAKVVRAGHKIYESPVSYVGRPYIAGKKIKPRDAFTAVETLWHYRRWRPQPVAEPEPVGAARG
ncbi:glycosyltransferase family 2 protein [Kouleothrix sp.]|uniref:glycosyltransferase family 2 protein n=1 Tax=Kouleothrix sp. TaxID=2779161 RepID=UPI00391D6839